MPKTGVQAATESGAALGVRLAARGDAARFYAMRNGAPAWTEDGRLNRQARDLIAALQGAAGHGLDPNFYHLPALAQAIDERGRIVRGREDETDAVLTDAFLIYASHLLNGHVDPAALEEDVERTVEARDLAADLNAALARDGAADLLEALAPQHPQYRLLREAYLRYAQAAAEAPWPAVDPGETLKPGMRDPRIAQVRARLDAEEAFDGGRGAGGAFATSGETVDPLLYDAALQARIEAFQRDHRLKADGAIGPNTLAMLNQGLAERAEAIRMNLERWRWLPNDLGGRYLLVNAPEYRLHVYEDGREALSMDVIVGRGSRKTPQFSDRIEYLVVNPDWNVPYSIATLDKLPKLKSDPAYFERMGYEIYTESGRRVSPYDVNWSNYSRGNFPFRLRQRPGPNNALGTIKFIFPNQYNVYLHDTDSPDLFAEDALSLSSGCVRVSDPQALARWMTDGDPALSMEDVEAAWASRQTRTLNLGEQIPVHLAYFTAWASDGGHVDFYGDIYGRDATLRASLVNAS
jgi:murein L,D-transpeptidase YcbB/YkuD